MRMSTMLVLVVMVVRVFMLMMIVLVLRVRGRGRLRHIIITLRLELFAGKILFTVDPNVHFCRGNPATHHPRNLKTSSYSERGNRLLQHACWNSGFHERAQKHVAAHAGKTFKVGNAHKEKLWLAAEQTNGPRPTTETFIIGNRSCSVKRAPTAYSGKITVLQ